MSALDSMDHPSQNIFDNTFYRPHTAARPIALSTQDLNTMPTLLKRFAFAAIVGLLVTTSVQAATYSLEIKADLEIMTVFMRGGTAHMVRSEGKSTFFELTPNDTVCVHHLHIIFEENSNPIDGDFDICHGPVLEISSRKVYN